MPFVHENYLLSPVLIFLIISTTIWPPEHTFEPKLLDINTYDWTSVLTFEPQFKFFVYKFNMRTSLLILAPQY